VVIVLLILVTKLLIARAEGDGWTLCLDNVGARMFAAISQASTYTNAELKRRWREYEVKGAVVQRKLLQKHQGSEKSKKK
jgi:hypothetical protein